MKIKVINEASTSRLYKRLTDDSSFAIVSPYRGERTEEENKEQMKRLKNIVRNDLKLGFNQFVSRWVEDGVSYDEESLLIPNISFEDAMKLGKEFDQSSIIYKDGESCREVCVNAFETYKPNDVVRTFNLSGNHIMNIEDAEDIFAKRKGGPSSMPKKGSNKKPFNLKENFELFEVEEPRASYFHTERHLNRII